MRLFTASIFSLFASAAVSLTTYIPESSVEIESRISDGNIEIPTAAFTTSNQPTETRAGRIELQSWRVDDLPSTTAILNAMINSYGRQGYELNFRCQASGCGGFAFRYGLDLASPPKFLVDLNNFEYVDLRGERDIVTIFASQVDGATFINQLFVQPVNEKAVDLVAAGTSSEVSESTDDRWVLKSVRFDSGSSSIAAKDDDELKKIAERLSGSEENVYIVGHTDQTGGLSGNLTVSQARANSVRQLLISEFGIDPSRIFAKGVAFLAPIADNATDEGRNLNRRVEAVFLKN